MNSSSKVSGDRAKAGFLAAAPPLQHYVRLLIHRKWVVVASFAIVTVLTVVGVRALPNVYTAQTLILVDPQKVPETYVKSTVTGSVRDRLSTLSQQILSATRLQKIIDQLHLYQEERKTMAREEIIAKMRKDIATTVVSDFGPAQDLQAFRISYNGSDPRLVALVTNTLATLFIDENLRAREQASSGTTEFIENQLEETRKALEDQETKLGDYRLKHIGEMPEQQNADLQILGQLQNQVMVESEALNRAEQQKALYESMLTQNAPVVDMDSDSLDETGAPAPAKAAAAAAAPVPRKSALAEDREKLTQLRTRYSDTWPDVVALKKKIQQEEAKEAALGIHEEPAAPKVAAPPPPPTMAAAKPETPSPAPLLKHFNPVLQGQIQATDTEIAKHKAEMQRISKLVANYQAKLEAIPVREEETLKLSRDYEMTKNHYSQLASQALSAETATQLEYRQKGEKFLVLDPAVAPEKPSKPNRPLLDVAGAMSGLLLGLALAMLPEFFGMTIIGPEDIGAGGYLTILETIPVIMTQSDRVARRRRMLVATVSAVFSTILAAAILFLRLRHQI